MLCEEMRLEVLFLPKPLSGSVASVNLLFHLHQNASGNHHLSDLQNVPTPSSHFLDNLVATVFAQDAFFRHC